MSESDEDDVKMFPFTHLHRRLVKEKMIPLHHHHNAPGYPKLSEDEMKSVKYDLDKSCDVLAIVKRKYLPDPIIELMINNWIRGIYETRRTSTTYYELFGHLFALYEKYNEIVSRYMMQKNTVAAAWFEYFWTKMDFIRADLTGCNRDAIGYKYCGITWYKDRPKESVWTVDHTFRPVTKEVEKTKNLPIFTCSVCSEELICFSKDELDKNSRQKPVFYPCSIIEVDKTEYICSEFCAFFKHTKEKANLRKKGLHIADPHHTWNVCPICFKKKKLFTCSVCKRAKYCSVQCQEDDFDNHKKDCHKLHSKDSNSKQ